jgi:hypothetical protein
MRRAFAVVWGGWLCYWLAYNPWQKANLLHSQRAEAPLTLPADFFERNAPAVAGSGRKIDVGGGWTIVDPPPLPPGAKLVTPESLLKSLPHDSFQPDPSFWDDYRAALSGAMAESRPYGVQFVLRLLLPALVYVLVWRVGGWVLRGFRVSPGKRRE